jgi:glycosyltransferase involved in cell wall biosynthesis
MSQRPLFSIVIPTKNRSFLVGFAIKSALRQTFPDLEVIVVDNDDTDATQKETAKFNDPRVRYIRTGGLSMPDNWEAGYSAARGEYVCILEDKQAFKGRALERVHQVIERNRNVPVKWRGDVFNDTENVATVNRHRSDTSQVRTVSCDDVLKQFTTNGRMWEIYHLMPIPHFSAAPCGLIDKIKSGPLKRLCPPVSPDITMGFQQLAFADQFLFIDEALVVTSTRLSNGSSGMMKSALFQQFTKELGGDEGIYYNLTPIKAVISENCIYNDYLTLQQTIQGKLLRFPINWATYFAEVQLGILKLMEVTGKDINMSSEKMAWKAALQKQPRAIRRSLWRQNMHATLKQIRYHTGLLYTERKIRSFFRTFRGRPDKAIEGQSRFNNILEYVEWDDSQMQK